MQAAAFSDVSPGRLVPTFRGAMAFVPAPAPRATASANIAKLVRAGILREITGRTRDRIYLAQGILDLMGDRNAPAASPGTTS